MHLDKIHNLRQLLRYDSIHPVLKWGERIAVHRAVKTMVDGHESPPLEFIQQRKLYQVFGMELPEIKYQREFEGGSVQALYRFENMIDFEPVENLKELIPKII